MAKYSYELKKKVVKSYLNGEGGYTKLAKKYNIEAKRNIELWVENYRKLGDEGLKPVKKYKNYPFEYKLYVVKLYLSKKVSYNELAMSEKMRDSRSIRKWVEAFEANGEDGLKPNRKEQNKALGKNKKQVTAPKKIKRLKGESDIEYIKKLEEELLHVQIENAFLKEKRRLRLEAERLQKK